MNRDRVVQLVTTLIAAGCLLGAVMLMPVINRQRLDLQLGFDLERGDQVPVKYALTAAALGTFRGIIADAAWYRAEKLKQDGKFHESNSLAQWITTLQPRFPQVWGFHAWNLAYNISVQTHTPQERWDWVNSGIRLLREQGIPLNPNATGLYRELGWIFFHKFGKYSDDMHWYYKRMLAEEWQEVLGAPTEGATARQAVAEFRPIADAADRYVMLNRLPLETRKLIDTIARDNGEIGEALLDIKDMHLSRAREVLADLEKQTRDPLAREQLGPLRERLDEQAARAEQDQLALLYEDAPAAQEIVEQLRAMDLALDVETLRRIGRIIMVVQYTSPRGALAWAQDNGDPTDQALLDLLLDPANRDGLVALLPFFRAKVLDDHYNMDAGVMYELMSGEAFVRDEDVDFTDYDETLAEPLPIDWRHPAAHGIYWAFLGVRKAGQLINKNKIDFINTDRQVIHGMQELMFLGKVSFDPFTGSVDLLPDPRFIDGYEKAVFGSAAALEDAEFTQKQGTVRTYESGHENFLAKAVLYSYLYGDIAKAQRYYDRLRRLYADKPHNQYQDRYGASLADFAWDEWKADRSMMSVTRQVIDAMIMRGITEGLALGRPDVFARFITFARLAHEAYEADKIANPTADQDRQKFLPFDQVLDETYINYMRSPRAPLLTRARAYANTPMVLRERTYGRFREALAQQCDQAGLDVDLAFPPPPNYEAPPAAPEGEIKQPPETVEIQ